MSSDAQERRCVRGARMVRVLSIAALAGATMLTASPTSAEWFADVYVGGVLTDSHDVSVKGPASGVRADGKLLDVDFDTSLAVGGRLGHWFEGFRFLGVALDVISFQPKIGSQTVGTSGTLAGPFLTIPPGPFTGSLKLEELDVNITGVSLDLLLRLPLLRGEQFPYGRLHPYLTAGPGAYITEVRHFDREVSVGWKAAAGLTWLFTKDIGLFAEYRRIHVEPHPESGRMKLEMTIDAQMVLAGLTARF